MPRHPEWKGLGPLGAGVGQRQGSFRRQDHAEPTWEECLGGFKPFFGFGVGAPWVHKLSFSINDLHL